MVLSCLQLKSTKLDGCITSLELMEGGAMSGARRLLLAGTRGSEVYAIRVDSFAPTLLVTCHRCAINDLAFPRSAFIYISSCDHQC